MIDSLFGDFEAQFVDQHELVYYADGFLRHEYDFFPYMHRMTIHILLK
jgi:hypothetical protein